MGMSPRPPRQKARTRPSALPAAAGLAPLAVIVTESASGDPQLWVVALATVLLGMCGLALRPRRPSRSGSGTAPGRTGPLLTAMAQRDADVDSLIRAARAEFVAGHLSLEEFEADVAFYLGLDVGQAGRLARQPDLWPAGVAKRKALRDAARRPRNPEPPVRPGYRRAAEVWMPTLGELRRARGDDVVPGPTAGNDIVAPTRPEE